MEYETPSFFQPDDSFIDWIIARAGDRMIFDIGYGNGKVLEHIWDRGFSKLLGTDPYSKPQSLLMYWLENKELNGRSRPHFFTDEIGKGISKSIIDQSEGKLLGLLNRPCHHPLLIKEAYYTFKESNNELLYIGLPDNVERDLDYNNIPYEKINHEGTSKDKEIVLKIA